MEYFVRILGEPLALDAEQVAPLRPLAYYVRRGRCGEYSLVATPVRIGRAVVPTGYYGWADCCTAVRRVSLQEARRKFRGAWLLRDADEARRVLRGEVERCTS